MTPLPSTPGFTSNNMDAAKCSLAIEAKKKLGFSKEDVERFVGKPAGAYAKHIGAKVVVHLKSVVIFAC